MTGNLIYHTLAMLAIAVVLLIFGWWASYHLPFLWKFTILFVPLALAAMYFQK